MKRVLSRLAHLCRSLAVRAGQATFRFPSAALAICVVSVLSNWAVAQDIGAADPFLRALLGLTAGAAASVAASLCVESWGGGLKIARLAGFVGLVLVGSAVGFAHPFLLHGPALTMAILTIVPLAPFVGRGSSRSFWDFALWTALGVTLGWFSVLVFLLGFTAIFEMVRALFGIGLGGDAYAHLFTTGLTLVGPLFALGRVPHPREVLTQDRTSERLEQAVRPLFEWVTAPLVIAASVIIHVYAAKILLTGDVPTNEIGWIVLLYSGFVLALRIGLEPYLADLPQPARFFARSWAGLLVVPLLLFAYALGLRVGSEGWTVERYASATYGLAAGIAVLAQVLPRTRSDVRLVVAAFPVLLVLSTFGPWGVAETVGRSQTALIERDFAGVLRAGVKATRGLDGPARQVLLSRLDALGDVDQTARLDPLLGAIRAGDDMAGELALRRVLEEGSAAEALATQGTERSFSIEGAFDVGGFDRVFPTLNVSVEVEDASSPVRLEANALLVSYRGRKDRFDLASDLDPLKSNGAAGQTLPAVVLDLRSEDGRAIRFRISHVRWSPQGNLAFLQGWLALRHGEWASLP